MTHPRSLTDEWLLDHAAGTAPEAVAVLLRAHLSLCPEARATAARLEAVGGALLDGLAPAAMAPGALDAVLARLDAPAPAAPPPAATHPTIPAALLPYTGADLDRLAWKRVVKGVDEAVLPTGEVSTYRMSLLRIVGGRSIPEHTHYGDELLMVLDGAFEDGRGHYVRGDVCAADDSVIHAPTADRTGDCLCLAVTSGPIKLTGSWGRLLNPLLRLRG